MPDGLSARIAGDTAAAMRRVQAEVQKANVAAVRAAGQVLVAEARRRATVYSGQRRDVPKGRLRKGIKAGRVVRLSATAASVKVGPRGAVVHKYAAKAETRDPYMKPAYEETVATIGRVSAEAYARAINKGSR